MSYRSIADGLPQPPLAVRWALACLMRPADRQMMMSDLLELYERRRASEGDRAAAAWLSRQYSQYPFRLLRERLRPTPARRKHPPRRRAGRPPAPSGPGEPMANLWRDLRYGFRNLAKAPVLAATVVLTVGLGIGATTTLFSVVHAVLLQPLPYAEPERLVRIYIDAPPYRRPFSVADYLALEEQQTSFEQVAGYTGSMLTVSRDEGAERVQAKEVTWTYFPLLGVAPLHGRVFDRSDAVPGGEPTVVVSHGFWARHLGADPAAVGKTLRLNGTEHRVLGVLPQKAGPLDQRSELFTVARWETPPRRGPFLIAALGRLRPGTGPAAAGAELAAINRRIFPLWKASYQDEKTSWALIGLQEQVVGKVRTTLVIVLAAVGLVLVIASVNAANLLVARATQRDRELALRSVLGASRGTILRQLLAESGLLALGAAAVGLGLAVGGIQLFRAFAADYLPRTQEIGLGGPVLAFLAAVTLGSGLLFGLIPSLEGARSRSEQSLRSAGRSATASARPRRLRRALVAVQFAVATPLLVAAGLFAGSLARLERVDLGFDTDNIATASLLLPASQYPEASDVTAFWDQATARIAALPGVAHVAFADGRPPSDVGNQNNFDLEDAPTPAGESQPTAPWVAVTPEYFELMGISLLSGRAFDERDGLDPQPVVIVDRAWAERFFPGQDAVGKRFRDGGCTTCPWTTVVGVVTSVKYSGLDKPMEGTVYWPMAGRGLDQPMVRASARFRYLLVRTAANPASVLPAIRQIVRDLDPALPLADVATIEELTAGSLEVPRYLSAMAVAFSVVALLLSMIGIYGVMSYFVQQHTKDIGIRLALGGQPASVLGMIVSQGMRVVATGLAVGIAGALLLTRFLASLLFEVQPTDALTFLGVSTLMLGAALGACWIPARRAAGVDPALTLREE